MGRIFNMDNKFFVMMGRVADLIILNLYFVISCIPLITIGPALTALHYVTMKMVKNEETYIWREYIRSFKQNFRQGIIIHIIMTLTAVLLFLDLRLMNNMTGNTSKVLHCVFLGIGVLYLMIWLYVYPILAKFYNSIRNTFTNAFLMSIRHLPYTILMAFICAAPFVLLFVTSAQISSLLLFVLVICGFSLVAFCNSFFLVKIFSNYIPKEEETSDTEEGLTDAEALMVTDPSSEALTDKSSSAGISSAQDSSNGTPSTEGSSDRTPSAQDSSNGTPSTEGSSDGTPSAQDSSNGTPSTEGSSDGDLSAQDSSNGTPSTEGSSDGTPSTQDSSTETPSAEGSSDGDLSEQDSSNGVSSAEGSSVGTSSEDILPEQEQV